MTWTAAASLLDPAQAPAVAARTDGGLGYVWVYGGTGVSPPVAKQSVQLYDVSGNSWSWKNDLPSPRMSFCASDGGNGKNYLFGGWDGGSGVFDTVWEHDPVADTYTAVSSMPAARLDHQCLLVGGLIYVIGGLDSSFNPCDQVWVYDPVGNSWTTGLASMPTARCNFGIAALQDGTTIYCAGGDPFGSSLDVMESYDTVGDTWASLTPFSGPRSGLSAAGAGGLIVTVAGLATFVTADNDNYTIATDTWDETPTDPGDLPAVRFQVGYCVFHGHPVSTFIVLGGRDGTTPRSGVWRTDLDNPAIINTIPPLRLYPRADGLTGSGPRLYPPPTTRQTQTRLYPSHW